MFITLYKKQIISIVLIVVLLVGTIISMQLSSTSSVHTPKNKLCIVIDAGHGGMDGGVVGYSGKTKESDINLDYAKCLASYFSALDINVIQTRKNKEGLYSTFSANKKIDDMKKREQIINSSNPDIVISIHQNGYILPNQRGICAFFNPSVPTSRELANFLQSVFLNKIEHSRKEALAGDYFILNCTKRTSVLIECGFLTNPDDEKLLLTEDYKQKVCYTIFSACVGYLLNKDILPNQTQTL